MAKKKVPCNKKRHGKKSYVPSLRIAGWKYPMVKRKIHLVKLNNWCMFMLAILVYQRASFLVSCLISGSRFDKPRRLNLRVWDCSMMNHGTVSNKHQVTLFCLSLVVVARNIKDW